MKYLGVDYGEKRIGLALGDDMLKIATPFKVVSNVDELINVIKEEETEVIVIGMPYKMGEEKEGYMQDQVEEFIKKIKAKIDIKIIKIDERLSSKGADALSGDKKTKAPRDALAAMLILQSYLDKLE